MKRIEIGSSRGRSVCGLASGATIGAGAKHVAAARGHRGAHGCRSDQPTPQRTRSSSPVRASAAIPSIRIRRWCSSTRTTSPRPACQSIADVLQRIPSASGGLNTKVNDSGNLGNPPDGGGVGAGSATIDLRYLGAQPHPGAGRRPALRQRHRAPAAFRARSTSTPSRPT